MSELAFARNLNSLARVDAAQQDLKSARENVLWSSRILARYADLSFGQLSFAEQCAFIDYLDDQTDLLMSVCTDAETLPLAYGYVCKWKGLLIESLRRRTALQKVAEKNPRLRMLVEQRAANHRQLEILADQNSLKMNPSQRHALEESIASFTNASEYLDREIEEQSNGIEITDPMDKKGTAEVRGLLRDNEGLVDIIAYRNALADKDQYVAVILSKNNPVILVNLKDASAINSAIANWRKVVYVPGIHRGMQPTEGQPAKQQDYTTKLKSEIATRQSLDTLVAQPILSVLPAGITRLWVCPDSDAALLPWSLFEKKAQMCTIDSPRELVSLKENARTVSKGNPILLLAAGIKFGDPSLALPYAASEFKAISAIASAARLTVNPFDDKKAVERSIVAALPDSNYAHFATHGFYSGSGADKSAGKVIRSGRSAIRARQIRANSPVLIDSRNPLMTSGLLLSGAKSTGDPTGESRLTADDIVGLDLHKCNLVALSACDTGLGKKLSGQGVLGLRSAIFGTGARGILMSLWKVDDAATSLLMKEFYLNLWSNPHKSPVESLKLAQQKIKAIPDYEHPFYWAGWVLAGDGWQ